MRNNPIETGINFSESLSQEQLKEKLSVARERYNQLLERAPEFYNQELYDLYVLTAQQAGGDLKIQTLLLDSEEGGHEAALQNYNRFKDFKSQQLGPIEMEIRDINSKIRGIENIASNDRIKQKEKEEEEKFQAEKNELADSLYEALDSIHSKIPKEAAEVGMNSTVALKTYLPELVYKAEVLEGYIRRVEEARVSSEIARIKKSLEVDGILNK